MNVIVAFAVVALIGAVLGAMWAGFAGDDPREGAVAGAGLVIVVTALVGLVRAGAWAVGVLTEAL